MAPPYLERNGDRTNNAIIMFVDKIDEGATDKMAASNGIGYMSSNKHAHLPHVAYTFGL